MFISLLRNHPKAHRFMMLFVASSTRRRLAYGAFWGGVAAVGARAIAVASSFALARILGQQVFGEYGIINSTAGMIGSLAGLGIGHTVTKYVAELKRSNPVRAGGILAISSLVTWVSAGVYAIAFVALAPWLAAKALAAPHLTSLLQISAITVALGVFNSVQSCSLSGCEAFKESAYVNVLTGIIQSALVVTGAWQWGIKGAVSALALGMIITVFITRLVVKKVWYKFNLTIRWNEVWTEWRVLLHYSFPTFLIIMLLGPVNWATNAFLANQPNGYAELGIFNASLQWQGAIQFLAGVICTAMIPVMSDKCGEGNIQASINLMRKMTKALIFVTTPILILLCSFSRLIMSGYGSSFTDGWKVMVIMVVTGAVCAIMTPVAHFVMASGMIWTALVFNLGMMATTLLGGWYMVQWGAEGLALSKLLAAIVHLLSIYFFINIITLNETRKHNLTNQLETPGSRL